MLSTPKAKAELFLASSLYDGLEDNNIKQVTTLLLSKEADPNILIPSQGITPFHLVIGNDSETFAEEVTKLFLRYGGNPNVRSVDGMTPVHVGAAWGRIGVLELLLASGGDPLLLDYEGRSPFHYAFDEGHYNAITVLGKYCGDFIEEDISPKYKIALGRVLVNNRGIVAEYAVSDDLPMTVNEIPIIELPTTCNNPENSTNTSNEPVSAASPKKHCIDWQKEEIKHSTTMSSTADESSGSVENFATLRRHPRCFPRRSEKCKNPKIESVCESKFEEQNKVTMESVAHESFFVQPKKEGEQMPRISSPKIEKCLKTSKTTPKTIGNQAIAGKFGYKTPMRIYPKKEQNSTKKTPLKISKYSGKPESTEKRAMKNETKTAERLKMKLNTYSADCSIISKSPNLMITPCNAIKKTPLQKKTSPNSAKKSARIKTRIPIHTKTNQSPRNTPNSAKNVQNLKFHTKTPKSTNSLEVKRGTESIKKREINKKTASDVHTKQTPFNKTYSKDEVRFSPDLDVNDRTINRKFLAKNIAIKLDETMYDDEDDKNYSEDKLCKISTCDPFKNNKTVGKSVKTESRVSSIIQESYNTPSKKYTSPKNDSIQQCCKIELGNESKNEQKISAPENSISDISENRGSSQEIHFKNILGMEFSGISKLPSSICERTNIEHGKKWRESQISPLSCGPYVNEIDNSSLSTDDSNYYSECYSKDITSDRSELDTDFLLKKEFFKGENDNFIMKNHLESLQANASAMTSSCESFVSLEEEYKYEDAEEGIILLERRFLVTPISIPMMKRGRSPSSTSEKSSCDPDVSLESCASSLPQSLAIMDRETLRKELTKLGQAPGPITATTHNVYLKRLWRLQKRSPQPVAPCPVIAETPKFSAEIEKTLRSTDWLKDLAAYELLDNEAFAEFTKPDPTRRWREGTTKSSFNYLLLDPRVTCNLPSRANSISLTERWKTFLSAVFYVGKGKRNRPYSHLYDATADWNQGKCSSGTKKINRILNIWKEGCGVVCLHVFQNTIPVEAYTREAAMIEVLGLDKLDNCKSGEYYGVAATWSSHQKRLLGMYLLYRAMQILLYEGERQLCPENI